MYSSGVAALRRAMYYIQMVKRTVEAGEDLAGDRLK